MRLLCAAALAAVSARAQLMPNPEVNKLTERLQQLCESVSIVIPDLPRATGPMLEQVRESRAALARTPQSTVATYNLLSQLRNFLVVADALPKPYPFPEIGVRQFAELRDGTAKLDAHFRALMPLREAALTPPDRDNLARYRDVNAQLGPPTAGRVVFLGDSITDGWRLNEYFAGKDFVNRGIGGQITSQMLARMKADVVDLKPKAMLVLAGTNDIARGTPLGIIENNLHMMCDLADAAKIKVILASVLPIHDYNQNVNPSYLRSKQRPPEQIKNLNAWLKTFAQNRGYVYLDYYNAMTDSAGFLRQDLAEDGLHPNATGYRVMAPYALRAIEDALKVPAGVGRGRP